MQTEKTMTAPAAVNEYNTKAFAAKVPCSLRTLKYWRNGRDGKPPKLLPARFDGRQAVYTDAQLETARKFLAQKSAKKKTHAELPLPLFDTQPESIDAREEIQPNSVATFEEPTPAQNLFVDTLGDSSADVITVPSIPEFDTPAETNNTDVVDVVVDPPLVEETPAPIEQHTLLVDAETGEVLTDEAQSDSPSTAERIAEAEKFFNLIYGSVTDKKFSYLWLKRVDIDAGKKIVKKETHAFDVSTPALRCVMAQKAIEFCDKGGWDVYFGVHLSDAPPNKYSRPHEGEITTQLARIADIDVLGGEHTDPNKYPSTFDDAKNFMPFKVSLYVNSGYGGHFYCLFDKPLIITDGRRAEAIAQNKNFLEVIRARADKFAGAVDAVQDLPRVLRVPGTRNYKLGISDNAPLVRLVEDTGLRFDVADLNEKLTALLPVREENLFDKKSARAADTKVAIGSLDSPLSDDDRKLVEYFRSDKCKEHDPNLYSLFAGNADEYFKNTGESFDDSVADHNLLLKIFFYIGGEGSDKEIAQRALRLFNQSGLAKRDKWHRVTNGEKDYQQRTLTAAFKHWVENGREARKPTRPTPDDESTSPLESLKAALRKAQKKLAEFDARKIAAIEHLRNVELFDSDTMFSEKVLTAAAFARLYDRQAFSEFKSEITRRNRKTQDKKVSFSDWLADVKEKVGEIEDERSALEARTNQLRAQIETLKFSATSNNLQIPCLPDYQISANGIFKVVGKKLIPVAPRPVAIKSAVKDFHSGNWKFKLVQMTPKGKWKILPTVAASTIANARKIVDLADAGLNVTSGNAALLVEYLANFKTQVEEDLPLTLETQRGGWHEFGGQEMFVLPSRDCVFKDEDEDKNISVEVSRASQFAQCLKTRGSLDEWKKAYELAKKYPIARFLVAASVAPPLLKILGERNFSVYTRGKTRAGKTTAQILAASTIGSEKVMRSFDATKNGLLAAAVDVNDFAFIVDEKQVADGRLKENLPSLIYSNGNGAGRSRANRDGSAKNISDWRTIAIFSGETELLPDNTTGGAHTRLLSLHAPDVIIPPDVCKKIRDLCKENFGHAFALVVDKIQSTGRKLLRGYYDEIQEAFAEKYPDLLDDHRRFVGLITLADALLNFVLYGKREENFEENLLEAIDNAEEIFKHIPTLREIDDTQREIDFVRDWVAQNQNQFEFENNKAEFIRNGAFGKLDAPRYIYITVLALKNACDKAGFDFRKLVADLIAAQFFIPADKPQSGRNRADTSVSYKIGKFSTRCFRALHKGFNNVV